MAQSGSNWANLPNELLNLIVANCGRDCQIVKWMFVNKKWFHFYLSQVYRSVSIDLVILDKTLDKILQPKFNVGILVKRITFKSLVPPSSLRLLGSIDLLGRLMRHTPNVEEVEFSSNFDAASWAYFSIVLMETGCWKLRSLPDITGGDLTYSAHYFVCANYLRNTLKKLKLSVGMMDVSNYNGVKEFPALEILDIGEEVGCNFFNLSSALQNLPNLKGISITLSNVRHLLRPFISTLGVYPNITEITLNNFNPKIENELIILTRCFPKLARLYITGEKNRPWPGNEIDAVIAKEFFDFIGSISEYQITVTGENCATNLIEKLLNSTNTTRKDSIIIEFSDKFTLGNVCLTIKKNTSGSNAVLHHTSQSYVAGTTAMEQIKNTVSYVKLINLSTDDITGGTSLHSILQKKYNNLDEFVLSNSRLLSFPSSVSQENPRLKSLEFHNCLLEYKPLQSFAKQFKSIDYINFDGCSFRVGGLNNISCNIDMTDTSVETMRISNFKIQTTHSTGYSFNYNTVPMTTSIITISINFVARNTIRNYIIMDNSFIEVEKATYDKIRSRLHFDEILNLYISVKSIQRLFIKPQLRSRYIKIDL